MREPNDATPFLPERRSLKALREASAGCRGCHLWRGATQTVFGEGRNAARVMLVGEQPGDKEDRAGKPFVGPAGRELDRGLEAAGIDRADAYVTNVVKHFKFEERGRRRIHQTPKRFEIDACKPWLEEELAAVGPDALVLLGATRRRRCSAAPSGSRGTEGSCSTRSWPRSWRRRSIRRRSCAARTTRLGPQSARRSRRTCASAPERFDGRNRSARRGYFPAVADAPRSKQFLLAVPEARALEWMARRLPSWIKPDHMTALGVVAALGIAAAYVLSNESVLWLWAASALLVVHWLGDSLDGTLARVRRSERPRYGYYLDHLVDAFATAAIGIGLGLSPHMLLAVGFAIVVMYLILSINTYLETHAFGVFTLGYGLLGPTEARLMLVGLNTLIALGVGVELLGVSLLDAVGIAIVAAMIVGLIGRAQPAQAGRARAGLVT